MSGLDERAAIVAWLRQIARSYRGGHTQGVWAVAFAKHRLASASLKDQVASPSDGAEWEGELTADETAMIDAAWEKHKAAGPPDPAAGVTADPWEEKCKAANKIGAFTKVRELADSPYADDDRIEVPIRFGDIRAIDRALASLRPQPDLRAMLEKLSKPANGVAFRIAYYGAMIDDSVLRENVKRVAREARALADEIDRALSDGAGG